MIDIDDCDALSACSGGWCTTVTVTVDLKVVLLEGWVTFGTTC